MPLYSDSNYYYSGGSSQLYSPYYTPGLYSTPSTSAGSSYAPYSSSYGRSYSGGYVVPLTPPRTPTYTSALSSRYQPKLTTITETSALTSARHANSLMPLTRIQSPKYSTYTSPSTSASSFGVKYIPPRPIPINTADIDVSSSRYRTRKQQEQEAAAKIKPTPEATSPSVSIKKRDSPKKKKDAASEEQKTAESTETTERGTARSTIKRNRAVVRLSTVRSRSKNRASKSTSTGTEEDVSSPEPQENQFRDLPHTPIEPEEKLSWRQKLADDLAAIPVYPAKKSPGDLIRERYLIQNENSNETLRAVEYQDAGAAALTPEPIIDQVVVELDPLHHTIRRLSIPQCPTFHDICEDISSDKIDDDLNAGALRRRASLIQEQEQELLNQLQKSASGTFQLIHLERQDSQDSLADEASHPHRQSKRQSKKGKKIRHKITAIVEIENAPLATILQEKEEDLTTPANKEVSAKPKFSFNVESVEEHHEINKIFKLPKKKSVKKSAPKAKEVALPEGFVHAKPKMKSSPKTKVIKKQPVVSTAEVFTFELSQVEQQRPKYEKEIVKEEVIVETWQQQVVIIDSTKVKIDTVEPQGVTTETESCINTKLSQSEALAASSEKVKPASDIEKLAKPKRTEKSPLKTSTSVDAVIAKTADKNDHKILGKSKSFNVEELKTPTTPTTPTMSKQHFGKAKSMEEQEQHKVVKKSLQTELPKISEKLEITQKTVASANLTTTTPTATAQKPKLLEARLKDDEPKPSVATPKPIRKAIQKSDSGEDFWTQIGTRETLYMTNRKKTLLEDQWQKRENLLEAQSTDHVKNLTDIKTAVTAQKEKALKKADDDCETTKKTFTIRSQSTEMARAKKSPKQTTAQEDAKSKKEQKTSPTKKTTTTPPIKAKSPKKTVETPLEAVEIKTTHTQAATARTIETTATPKISSGQTAKSPEQQQQATNKFTTTAAASSNKDKMATLTDASSDAAKKADLATTSTATAAKATATAATNTADTATKQPEIKDAKLAEADKKTSTIAISQKTADANVIAGGATKLPPTAKPKTAGKIAKVSPTGAAAKAQTAPSAAATPINADQFVSMAPAKAATSPNKGKTASPPTPTIVAATSHAADKIKATAATTAAVAAKAATTTTIASTPAAAATATSTTSATATTATSAVVGGDADGDGDGGGGNNLAKFATVSNLAQCLQDVDADIEDYIPSSADDSDDSSYDNSSANGCANLSASMKKKLKQRRRKEKLAEQARFDPQKKVKIDTTNKCYVKDEPPRYPLVATPRPLWKREKVIYTENSDESDSDESGSTEETEDSEECTTSEEYEDELNGARAAGTGSNTSKENSAIIRMSTCSNDSGFEGGTAPSSPKKMLECDVNCHKKCERLTANLCGVNQKLIVEALAYVKRGKTAITKIDLQRASGARETRDSPSTPPSLNPAYKIEANEEQDETSYTYSQFQKSGRFTAPATVIPRFKNYCVDDFHFLTVLGKGSFGKVLLAELRDTTYYYAVKCLKKDVVLEDDDVDSTLIERKVLALGTKHPYLCHLFCTFQTESHLFFVMEYLNGGDLMFHIQESGRFSEERARFYGAEIISGLKFLHKKGIIYRDLKLDNVLLDYEGHVRIADFGMCKLQIYLDKTADSFCGTPDYMAPEIVKGEKYNQNVDWWSFGVLLYEMLIGQSPFSGCDEDELFWSICNEIPWFPVYISAEATSILKGLLEKDYTKRIGSQYSLAGDISEHIFFRPIDWKLLEKRQMEPPFKPQVKHPLDTQYFDRVFTRERVRLTPIDKDILQSMDQKQFHGFTYTNPHITLD